MISNMDSYYDKRFMFNPNENLTQKQLNVIVSNILCRLFSDKDGKPIQLQHEDKPVLMLIQLVKDLNITLDEKTFNELPDEVKNQFCSVDRHGSITQQK